MTPLRATWAWRFRALLRPLLQAKAGAIGWRAALARVAQVIGHWRPGPAISANAETACLLVIDQRLPDPTLDSGSVRMLEILGLLGAAGHRLVFMADDGQGTAADIARLQAMGVTLIGLPGQPDLPRWLGTHHLEAALLARFPVAEEHLTLVRRMAPEARILFDTVDLHFLRLRREAALGNGQGLSPEALDAIERRELAVIDAADATFVVSETECTLLSQRRPDAEIKVLSNIHVPVDDSPGPDGRADMLFVGGMSHAPNLDAVRWFCGDVLPRIRQRLPDAGLHIVGEISEAVRAEFSSQPGVTMHGRIAHLQPLLDSCRLSVAPLRFGAGVKGKVNSAMSHGLPVVATSVAAEGMHLADGRDVLIADDGQSFADACIRLFTDDALWRQLSEGGRENIRRHFSREAAAAVLEQALER